MIALREVKRLRRHVRLKRVLVIGTGGSGKSTVARRLAQRTGLPLIHLDAHYWRPGWQPTPPDEWRGEGERLGEGHAGGIHRQYGGGRRPRARGGDSGSFFFYPLGRSLLA